MPDEKDYRSLIKERVGDYVIDDYVGVGGQAVVYLAHAIQFPDRKYALKVFGLIQSSPESLNIGLSDAQKQMAVQHSSVVRIYMPGTDDIEFKNSPRQVLYIPMDFSDLGNCYETPPFKDRHLSVWDYRTMAGLLDGLKYIHNNQIIHEDIKPANILQFFEQIDGEERIVLRITDFGIAKLLSALIGIRRGDPTGVTPQFMFPEQMDHRHTEKGDIYSMGATLFYMLTGELPIIPDEGEHCTDPFAWQRAHKTKPRPNAMKHSVYCPPRLALLIIRMMSIEANDRPTLDECKSELSKIIETHDLKALSRLPLPEDLKKEFDRNQFPIQYVPKDFPEIFKPKIHEICGTQLYIIRVKMGHPVYSQYKVIIEYLVRRLSDCFSFYETWGTYDINMLLWGKYEDVKGLKKNLEERFGGCRVHIRLAGRVYDFHCDDLNIPNDADPVYALATQEDKNLPGLNRIAYLCKAFPNEIPEYSVRAFTYVEPSDSVAERFIRNAIIRNVQEELSKIMHDDRNTFGTPRFHRMTMIELSPQLDISISENDIAIVNDPAVLLVNFVASQYKYLSDVPTAIIAALGENAVKTSTFLETRRVVFQSDKILF